VLGFGKAIGFPGEALGPLPGHKHSAGLRTTSTTLFLKAEFNFAFTFQFSFFF